MLNYAEWQFQRTKKVTRLLVSGRTPECSDCFLCSVNYSSRL